MSEQQPFWDFACKVYDNPTVQAICLDLQNDEGLDVNCLLFCLWMATSKHGIRDDGFWSDLVTATIDWQQEILAPLRGVRNSLKTKSYLEQGFSESDLRSSVLDQELSAEKLQILWMESRHKAEAEKHEALSSEECLQAYLNALPSNISVAGREKALSLATIVF